MKTSSGRWLVLAVFALCLGVAQLGLRAQDKPLRGWLADERCARGRANSGVYTGTNPDCAKKCVEKGAKIVLVVPDQKEILSIENQEAAKSNIGNFVEVTGKINRQAKTLHIDAVKLLEEGRAMCTYPRPKK